jgi:hypothetical protein
MNLTLSAIWKSDTRGLSLVILITFGEEDVTKRARHFPFFPKIKVSLVGEEREGIVKHNS